MQGFYNLSEKIRQTLQLDDFVNTVTYGDIYDVDLNKQTIFPLSQFRINSATMQGNVAGAGISTQVWPGSIRSLSLFSRMKTGSNG